MRLWHSRLSTAKKTYDVLLLIRFFEEALKSDSLLCGKSLEELLQFQEDVSGRDKYRVLQAAQNWIQAMQLRLGSKARYLSIIRSFFMHNHVELPLDRSFKFKSSVPCVVGRLTIDDFRKIVLSSKPMWQSVFLSMFQGAMGKAEIIFVNNNLSEYVIEQIMKGKRRIKLEMAGRKQNRNKKSYATMIGKDAIDAIKRVMQIYQKHKYLFVTQFGKPITETDIAYYFTSRCIKTGLRKPQPRPCKVCRSNAYPVRRQINKQKGIWYECGNCGTLTHSKEYNVTKREKCSVRYGVGSHEIRDLFRSEWQLSGADPTVAEFMLGHDIDPNDYNKCMELHPEYLEEQFRIAEPFLDVVSEEPRKVSRQEVFEQLEVSKSETELLKREVARLTKVLAAIQLTEDDRIFLSKKTEILDALRRIERLEKKLSG